VRWPRPVRKVAREVRSHADQPGQNEQVEAHTRVGRVGRWFDERTGAARVGRGALNKIFPNHWSFLLGEVALYSFLVLVGTGIFLTFFFDASTEPVIYDGSYAPLQGVEVSQAYDSAMDLTFDVRAGLVMRQIHHWAALVFVAAIVLHLCRIFFTGGFRRPREINWVIGCALMLLAILNGFAGYSLLDDQLSGTGVRVGYSIILSIPVIGTWMASLLFGGNFPGTDFIPRLFVIHILIVPLAIFGLLAVHLGMLIKHKHTHFAGQGATEHNVVGERLWPTYVFKAGGLFFLVFAVLAALGGLAQINPVWIYGPFRPENVSSASQPDWYMGWADGALRLMPNWEVRAWGFTIPNPFWGGVLLPGITFTLLFLWPWLEARFTKDRREHHVLDRPRDRPVRTALGVSTLVFYTILGVAASNDVIATTFGLSVNAVLISLRVAVLVAPPIAAYITYKLCTQLAARSGPIVDPSLIGGDGDGTGGDEHGAPVPAEGDEGGFPSSAVEPDGDGRVPVAGAAPAKVSPSDDA
jgi:ubiquinol-cytochrome c reductase cytochrome b subunit